MGFDDFRAENGSSQGHNLALTGVFVSTSPDNEVGKERLHQVRSDQQHHAQCGTFSSPLSGQEGTN
jgi:hypothetical protein